MGWRERLTRPPQIRQRQQRWRTNRPRRRHHHHRNQPPPPHQQQPPPKQRNITESPKYDE